MCCIDLSASVRPTVFFFVEGGGGGGGEEAIYLVYRDVGFDCNNS